MKKQKKKNEKPVLVKPAERIVLGYIAVLSVFIGIIIWGCIFTLLNDDEIDQKIMAIGFTSFWVLIYLICVIYYFSYKVYAYNDRFVKYNIFRFKRVYYYNDLTLDQNLNWSIFYKGKKKVFRIFSSFAVGEEEICDKFKKYKKKQEKLLKKQSYKKDNV